MAPNDSFDKFYLAVKGLSHSNLFPILASCQRQLRDWSWTDLTNTPTCIIRCLLGNRFIDNTIPPRLAITIVHNDIIHAIDAGEVLVLVLLDRSAAFDTVDHDVLLDVLQSDLKSNYAHLIGLGHTCQADTIVLRYVRTVGSCQFAMQCSARLQNRSAEVYHLYGGYCRNNTSFLAKPPSLC